MKTGLIIGFFVGVLSFWLAQSLLVTSKNRIDSEPNMAEQMESPAECGLGNGEVNEINQSRDQTDLKDPISEKLQSKNTQKDKIEDKESSQSDFSQKVNSSRLDRQACLEVLKPSDLPDLHKQIELKITDFLTTNDKIFVTDLTRGGHYTRDVGMLNRMRGKYKFKASYFNEPGIETTGELEIKSATDGRVDGGMSLKTYEKNKGGKGGATMSSSGGIDFNVLGTDSTNEHLNFVWNNGYTSKWPKIIRFAIQIPADMSRNERRDIRLYSLNEEFIWNEIGEATIERVE